MHIGLLIVVGTAALAAKPPRVSVCTGSICSKHSSALVLEAAQALACTTEAVEVVPTRCMSACKGNGLVDPSRCAVFVSATKSKVVLSAPYESEHAVAIASDMLTDDVSVAAEELLRSALEAKLAGTRARFGRSLRPSFLTARDPRHEWPRP